MPTFRIDVGGLEKADTALRRFARTVDDLRPFWSQLGERLSDEAQRSWPLKRRSGKLRKSLVWRGDKLGPHGIFEADPDRLTFGTAIFYGRFAQTGTKRQRQRTLIHVDAKAHSEQLTTWLRDRAASAGLEVT